MAKNNALNFNLPSADDLFSTEESRAEARLETQFRAITLLTREKCAHLQENAWLCRFPLSTPHPFQTT